MMLLKLSSPLNSNHTAATPKKSQLIVGRRGCDTSIKNNTFRRLHTAGGWAKFVYFDLK